MKLARAFRFGLVWSGFIWIATTPFTRANDVSASLSIPPAETYVLGDAIPLVWEFTNRGTNPLAMLWEGCCRVNGKLTIESGGKPVAVLPPGAASFHTYSKAEKLPTDEPVAFQSLLSDWVQLPTGGQFEIGGRYTGVLTNQTPQVPDDWTLWRGTTEAKETQLSILSVEDYLAQREDRSTRRGVAVSLDGPGSLPALDPAEFTVSFRNLSATHSLNIPWPGTVQLWLVNPQGIRLPKATQHLKIQGEELVIPPGESVTRAFAISSDDLNGEPFGDYTFFLDLGPVGDSGPRLPSNALSLAWNLGAGDIARLLNEAGGGPATGMRNPALKLLRVYLPAVTRQLHQVDDTGLDPRAIQLKEQLTLAGCLHEMNPRPGRTELPIITNPAGPFALALPEHTACVALKSLSLPEQIERIFSVRRHLGWDLAVTAQPEPDVRMHRLFELTGTLAPVQSKLSGPLSVPWIIEGVTNTVVFPNTTPGANLVVWITSDGASMRVAFKEPVPGRPPWLNHFSAEAIAGLKGESIARDSLEAWLAQNVSGVPQVLVMADGDVSWQTLTQMLAPLMKRTAVVLVTGPNRN